MAQADKLVVLFNSLLNRNFEVTGTSRRNREHPSLLKFDLFTDNWNRLGQFDVVINCIGAIESSKGASFKKVYIELTRKILENKKVLGDPRILQISALGASIDRPVAFLRTKAIADELLLAHENTYVIRPSIVCMPSTMLLQKLKLIHRIARYTRFYFPMPERILESKIQPVIIDDLVEVIIQLTAGKWKDRIIEVGGAEQISYRELFTISGKLQLVEINEWLCKIFVRCFIAPLFPELISYEQFQLMFYYNTTNSDVASQILGRKLQPTKSFWANHLKME